MSIIDCGFFVKSDGFVYTDNSIFCYINYAVIPVSETSGIKEIYTISVRVQFLMSVTEQNESAILFASLIFKVIYTVFYSLHIAVGGVNPAIIYCADVPCGKIAA